MGGILDIFGASKTRKAIEKAADKSAAASQYATDQSLALQKEQFERVWAGTQVSRDAGNAATTRLSALSGLTPNVDAAGNPQSTTDWLRSTPGFDANFQTGTTALNTSLAKRGMGQSGAAARAAIQFGQQYGDRIFNTERSALQSLAGLGQTALNTGAATGQATANASQSALVGNAQNLSSSYRDRADASAGFWGTMTGTFGQQSQVGTALRAATGGF